MKKLVTFILSALGLAALLAGMISAPATAASQASTRSQDAQPPLTFAMLGQTDTLMRGPFATTNIRFGLPINWAFQDGASLKLILSSNLVTSTTNGVTDGQPIGASLTVRINKKTIASLPLVAGINVPYDIPIPKDTLVPALNDGRHDLELFLDASTDCNINNGFQQTTVTVSSASELVLPYSEQTPVVDLKQLPGPIYQRDSVFPATVNLVIPDQPSEQEMRAALIVSAGFGRLTDGNLPIALLTSKQVTQDIAAASNLIFVGKASTLTQLQNVELPAPLKSNAFDAQGMQTDDGILQMAVSPWSNGRAIVVVSGNTDAGVVKAAQAFSHGQIQPISNSNLALVTDVAPSAPEMQAADLAAFAQARSFKDLGHDVETIAGAGRGDVIIDFYVPPGLAAGKGSYLELQFNNSALLDFGRSGLTVFLNGKNLGGVRLTQDTAASTTQRINIAPSLVLPGDNQLRIQGDLSALTQCSLADVTNLWVSILPESSLYLPLEQPAVDNTNLQSLSVYPYPFVNLPTLSSTAFILPKNDPAAWAVASQIAYGIGNKARGSIFDLAFAYDGAIPDDIRTNRDLIVVGLPADLPLLSEIKDALPAPFEAGKNEPTVKNMQVTYRVASGTSTGYLELLSAPWAPERTILAVVGSTHDGVQMAGNALTDSTLRNKLAGNFALVNVDSVSTLDTRTGIGMGGVASNPQVVSEPAAPEAAPGASTADVRPSWVLPVVGVLAALILIVLIAALVASRREPGRS